MKQLKFMLAAATAIGLATAAQAATQEVKLFGVNTPVDTFEVGTPSASLTGYTYLSDDGENDSKVEDGTLKVSTGTNPYLRALDFQGGTAAEMDMTGFESLYIDTEVQFTVTPAGDEVIEKTGDKLMIYLAEFTNKVEGASAETPVTNLVVKAAGIDPKDEQIVPTDYIVSTEGYIGEDKTIKAGKWYRLKVVAKLFGEDGAYYPGFSIYIAEKGSEFGADPLLRTEEMAGFDDYDTDSYYFPSMALVGTSEGVKSASLQYVGFAGEGAVDNLTAVKLTVVNSVDFTLTLDEGVSAVQWTIGGVAQSELTGKVNNGQTIAITDVEYKDWYCADGTYVEGWFGVYGTDVTANITVGAKEVTSTDLGVTVPDSNTPVETVNAALAWAKAANKTTTEVKNAANIVANYLLAVDDLDVEPKIKITQIDLSGEVPFVKAEITNADGTTTIKELTAKEINSDASIKYKAAATLDALKTAKPKNAIGASDKFIQVVVE